VKTFRIAATLAAGLLAFNAHAGLFEDDEARRAILDLRQKVDAAQTRTAEELRRTTEDNAQLRRSLLDLSNQIDALRNELATMRGQNENLARSVAEMQRTQKDLTTGVDERLRKFEPGKVNVDGKEFVAEPAERQEFEAALATLRKGDFAAAQTSFLAFMKRYPHRLPGFRLVLAGQCAVRLAQLPRRGDQFPVAGDGRARPLACAGGHAFNGQLPG